MHASLPPVMMTHKDHRRLMRTARELAEQVHPLASPLRRELDRATLHAPDQLPDDVVTLDRFVTYRLADGGRVERRALILSEDGMWPHAEVSVLTPVGLSLLGLRPGDRMPVIGSDGPMDAWVEVEGVGLRVTGGLMPVRL
ncbi:GreA/GreB family elongation factor [Microvirga lotononidis]|uniref:Transcription elongation factor n=1 Tax=Microvirga lotononidis TaxID=864069 RepID=I4YS48_9HYPH|nr:GreA/GreB family elongation factor [Microvirga lotononidis]EIM26790.1 transcription elongation factor [Microvirga lotononidis]WQO31695.1 GreA/GreB family elongation factor [Microvirga lotononidis]